MEEARATSLSSQLERGFHALRFDRDLEAAWRRDQFRENLRFLRINLCILVALALAVIQLDHVVMPVVARIVPDLARTGVMMPLLAAGFVITFLPRAHLWYPRYIAAAMTVALVAIAWIGIAAWSQGEPRVFARLVIAVVAVYFVVGLQFRSAVVVNLIGVAAYGMIATLRAMPADELTQSLSMLVIVNVICVAGAYSLEHARRTAWLEGQLLAKNALQDGLTGISNRRRFDDHLERMWSQAARERKPIALLLADLDHFKRYNDRYGHQAGDEALERVASVLARFARRPLDLAARYGGEELALVLYDASAEAARRIGDEILPAVQALRIAHADSSTGPALTVSIGIGSVVPDARRSWQGLVQLADQALYAAKDGGRNQARLVEGEYEHMKTGFFHRSALKDAK